MGKPAGMKPQQQQQKKTTPIHNIQFFTCVKALFASLHFSTLPLFIFQLRNWTLAILVGGGAMFFFLFSALCSSLFFIYFIFVYFTLYLWRAPLFYSVLFFFRH
uniref:(northern house mosquito) hypothetical protein n=1 Tax=Culex pipiens TaxID=7175 RepID=A0A8D8MR89_CULPI